MSIVTITILESVSENQRGTLSVCEKMVSSPHPAPPGEEKEGMAGEPHR